MLGLPGRPAAAITRSDLAARVQRLQTTLNAIADRMSQAEADLEFANVAIAKHLKALQTASTRIAQLRFANARRSSEMYITGDQFWPVMGTSTSIDVFAERLGYLDVIRSDEQSTFEDLVALKRRARVESAELEGARARAQRAYERLAAERADLSARFREYRSLLGFVDFAHGSRGRIAGFACPVAGPHAVSNDFGAPRPGGPHQGDDIQADTGTPVVAVLPSRVVDVVHGGWMGRGIIIRDGTGTEWWYAHLSKSYVSQGEVLGTGEMIGRVGCSGHCTGPHLHFEYHPDGGPARNPYRILSAAC